MTTITARALLQEWLDTNSLEGQYVPMAECNKWRELALTNLPVLQAAHMQHKEDTTTVSQLIAILQQWHNAATWLDPDGLRIIEANETMTTKFEQLIADTQSAIGGDAK